MITYMFFKYLFMHLKYTNILNKVYKNENLLEKLSQLFNIEFKKDWVHRVYAVFNPYIQDGIFDPNNQIYEYTSKGLVNDAYIEAYIMNKLNSIKQFIQDNNLFDLLTYKLVRLDDNGNYLFIIQPITWDDFKTYLIRFLILLGVLLIIGTFSIYFIYN